MKSKRHWFDKLVSDSKKIVVTTHQNPDPDGLCSALGVSAYLDKAFPDKMHEIVSMVKLSPVGTGWRRLKK